MQFVIGLMMVAAALAATVMRNRLASVILVGLSGYGCGVLFALHGAPDLALTQFLVETLTLVIFVLVLRKLPAEVDERRAIGFKIPRALLAVAVGATVTTIGAYAINARNSVPIYERLPDAAYYLGNGKNVVNVLLVDIRAWDTLGEISVLLVAATGVASLVFRNRRFGSAPRVSDAPAVTADSSASHSGDHVAARRRPHRPETPVAGPRGDDPADLPDHHGVVGLLLLRRSQRARRRFRRRPHGRSRAGPAVPRGRTVRTRRNRPDRRGQDPGPRASRSPRAPRWRRCSSAPRRCPPRSFEVTLPLLGHVKMVTALFFDLGVYLIVVGLVLDVLRSLGARLDAQIEVNQR